METPFHPVIRQWFSQSFGAPTDVQTRAWKSIIEGQHTLIAAPTGSGKTLAALLPCLHGIAAGHSAESAGQTESRKGVKVLYVTPLKALNNDIHHHMFRFAAEMSAVAREMGAEWTELAVGVRTGDTTQSTRASMLRNPPHVLVTTPESLYLMVTSLKAREILRTVEQVIVDEIHDLAGDKRGVHLSLSLERLASLCGRNPQRIGVSATQKPLDRVARFLGGWERAASESEGDVPRPVSIVESAMERRLDVLLTMPARAIRALDKEAVWGPLVERLLTMMDGSRSVLVFVNNRRLCERLTLRLNDYVGYEMAKSHHGSVSRERRLEVESMLKTGELRCLVATATLELGIDVGYVDLVIQIDSPKQAAAGIQRIGRAGHAVGGESRGVFVIRGRADLPEAAVLARSVALRDIEEIQIPHWSLDVLAQQTVAAVAASAREGNWSPLSLYRLFVQSDCYQEFPYERFLSMLDVLAGLFPFCRPLIGWDRETDRLSPVPASSMAASMGAGTILQSSSFPVHHVETRLHLGELDEEYVYESRVGDVFQLGTSSWSIQAIRQDRVYVAESANPLSEIPFWRAEQTGRSALLGRQIGSLLAEVRDASRETGLETAMTERLIRDYYMDRGAAEELIGYVHAQDRSSLVPVDTLIVAEHYKDDGERHHLVVHSVFGRRINRTWEMLLRARFDMLSGTPVYSTAKDDGIEFVFSEWNREWMEELVRFTPVQVEESLWQALPGTSMLAKAFRHIAETSLLLARGFQRQSSWKKRHVSERLLKDALPFAASFPFLREAYSVCLEDNLDVPGFLELLEAIHRGTVMLQSVDSAAPSPFAVKFINDYAQTALYESDALGRDVQMRLMNLNRSLAAEWFGPDGMRAFISRESLASEKGRLDRPDWLQHARRTEGEGRNLETSLLRLLKEYGDLSAAELARYWAGAEEDGSLAPVGPLLDTLEASGRLARLQLNGEERWISRDEAGWYESFPGSPEALAIIVKRYVERVLSFTPEDLERRYGVDRSLVHSWLQRLQQEGVIEHAPFAGPDEPELYTSCKVAGRVVRASIRDFRQQHAAVEPVRYAVHLLARHHLLPERQLEGEEGLLEAVAGLQGIYLPLPYWESTLFPSRVRDYKPALLDQLCASGEIFWLGRKEQEDKEGRIAFFRSDSRAMAEPYMRQSAAVSSQPELLALLERKGASFLSALARETGELPSVLFGRLMELVWEGSVSNDQFAPLRSAASGKGGKTRAGGFQSGLGRWYAAAPAEEQAEDRVQAAALEFCRHWIEQYGILTRSASSVASPYSWDQLSEMLRRLEEWGMITRGFFIHGIPAMQFSTKEQVEGLETRAASSSAQPVLVSAADPANPFGAWLDWPELAGVQFARKPGNFLVFSGERWLLWVESYGKHIYSVTQEPGEPAVQPPAPDSWSSILGPVMRTLMSRYHLRKIVVERWNGARSAESEMSASLAALGGEKDVKGYVFWPSSLRNS